MGKHAFLRDHADHVEGWAEQVARLRAQEEPSERGRLRQLSRLGDLLRMHPSHSEESIVIQRQALDIARRWQQPRPLAIVQLRLAIALQYAGRHQEALTWFDHAEQTIRENRLLRLRDFVEQHRGKCLAELGRTREARVAFCNALRLRRGRRKRDQGLIASTEKALAMLPDDGELPLHA
jgi:hypothetical protein